MYANAALPQNVNKSYLTQLTVSHQGTAAKGAGALFSQQGHANAFAPNVKRTGVPDNGSLSRGGARAQPLVGHMVPYHPEDLGVDGKLKVIETKI